MKLEYFFRTVRNRCPRCNEGAVLKGLFHRTKNVQIVILYTVVKMDSLSVEYQLVMD
jgi:hypothetical protein